jgi:hypothetical protein
LVVRLPLVVRGWVRTAVAAGAVETGPRSAEAFSMPGLNPVACPPEGIGGALNGSAGLTKLVTPGGAADTPAGGDNVCTGGAGAGALTAALDGGKNIPIAGLWAWAIDGAAGAWLDTLASGDTVGVLGLVAGADSDWPANPEACDATDVAGEITAVAACSVALMVALAMVIPALAATSAAAIAGAATDPPATDGNADSPANPAPNASNPAPYRNPAEALLGHINPKYSVSKSINRGVNAPNTDGLIPLSTTYSNRFAFACTWVTICGTVVVCNSPAAANNCDFTNDTNPYSACSPPNAAADATADADPNPW